MPDKAGIKAAIRLASVGIGFARGKKVRNRGQGSRKDSMAISGPVAGQASTPQADDDEDVIDGVIRKSGCELEFRKFEDCMIETNRDFRQCQPCAVTLQVCMAEMKKVAASEAAGSKGA